VGVGVGEDVGVHVGVFVGVLVGLGVSVGITVSVAVGVAVGGTGVSVDCGTPIDSGVATVLLPPQPVTRKRITKTVERQCQFLIVLPLTYVTRVAKPLIQTS